MTYAATVLADSPYFYWEAQDASGALQDSTANNRDSATPTIDAYRVRAGQPPSLGYAIYANGQHNGADYGGSIPTLVNNFTVEMWFSMRSGISSYAPLFEYGKAIYGSNGVSAIWDGTKVNVHIDGTLKVVPDSAMSLDTWYHYVVRRESGTLSLTLNGVLQADTDATAPSTPTGDFSFLEPNGGTGPAFSVTAYGCHFAFYDSVLSDARILAHYAARHGAAGTTSEYGTAKAGQQNSADLQTVLKAKKPANDQDTVARTRAWLGWDVTVDPVTREPLTYTERGPYV